MKTGLLMVAAMLSLIGCASRPESIRASFVSHEKYAYLDCPALESRMTETRKALDATSKMQDEKATGDAVGVFCLASPSAN